MAIWLKSFEHKDFNDLYEANHQSPFKWKQRFKDPRSGLQKDDIVYLHSKGGKSAQVLFKMLVIEKTVDAALLKKLKYVKKDSLLRTALIEKGFIRETTLVGGLSTNTRYETMLEKYTKLFEYIEAEFKSSDYPDEADTEDNKFPEGGKKTVSVNKYERSSEARAKCIEIYDLRCYVCTMSFEHTYGDFAKDFIHVHHIKPLHEIGEKYEVDPKEDLRPVCPNCHAMLHKTKDGEAITIDDLKRYFKERLDNPLRYVLKKL